MLRGVLSRMYQASVDLNEANIVGLAKRFSELERVESVCDLGCGDARLTAQVAQATGALFVGVVETNPAHVQHARSCGFSVWACDLNRELTVNRLFDVVFSNQVIEHLYDTDEFLRRIRRILRSGGLLIVSTENAASWHNIGALVLGWQPFSATNFSNTPVGNPFALHVRTEHGDFAMQHHRIFSLRALKEVIANQGYRVGAARGAGYYPLPADVGNLDPSHAHFIAVSATAP